MVYLVLTVITSTLIIVVFKLFPRFKISVLQAITINYLVASVFGYLNEAGQFHIFELIHRPWFPFSLLVGGTLILGFHLFALSARYAGVAVTGISSRMSVIIPAALGFLIFSEKATPVKLIGIVAALAAFYLVLAKRGNNKEPDRKMLLLPFLLFLVIGANDSLMKYAQFHHIEREFVLFLATAFAVSLLLGIIILLFRTGSERPAIKNIVAGTLLGLLNWWSTYYFLRGLDVFDVSVFIPLVNISIVALAALTGFFIFREKLKPVNWLGILLAMIAIALIASVIG